MPPKKPVPPSRVAVGTLLYAFPITVGIVLLGWSAIELVSVFSDAYWIVFELLPVLVVSTLGTGLTLFGGIGALAHALQSTPEVPTEDR